MKVKTIHDKKTGRTTFVYESGDTTGVCLSIDNPKKIEKILTLVEDLTSYERGWLATVIRGRI